jgi:hypothetical protein
VKVQDVVVLCERVNADGSEMTSGYTASTVLASDVVADLLGRLLNQYDGALASITASTYAIDQLAYPDGVTAEQVLNDLLKFEPDFIWEALEEMPNGKARFNFRQWGSTVRYHAIAVGGFESPGSAVELFNAVNVRWVDELGRSRITRRTQAVPELDDEDLTREGFVDLGSEAGSPANAIRAGDQFLAGHAIAPNAGTLRVKQPIFDAQMGRMVKPWEIRPGYLLRVRDVQPRLDALNASDRDGVSVFRLVGVEYNADQNEATLELDSAPQTLQSTVAALSARVAARRR